MSLIPDPSLPGEPKKPSERDEAIFFQCEGLGCSQRSVAQRFGISQPRVVQILQRVAKYRADAARLGVVQPSRDEKRERAARECQQRAKVLLEWTMEQLYELSRPRVLHRVRKNRAGRVVWRETITQEYPLSTELVRICQVLSKQLRAYNNPPPAATPKLLPGTDALGAQSPG